MKTAMTPLRVAEVCGVSAFLGIIGGLFGFVGVPPAACVAYSYAIATEPVDKANVAFL